MTAKETASLMTEIPTATSTNPNSNKEATICQYFLLSKNGQFQWRWAILLTILLSWVGTIVFVMPNVRITERKREGHNLVYWTPHKTGSTSMRYWLKSVADILELKLHIHHRYPNNHYEDFHSRAKRMGLESCDFLAGHIRITPQRSRENELKLGAVISTIRDPYALLASKYFHRTRKKMTTGNLKKYKDPKSQLSRLWFFYWNDYDPCEQLRYYDGLYGCDLLTLSTRIRKISERIDCIVDTDDSQPDLKSLCHVMGLPDDQCPEMPNENIGSHRTVFNIFIRIPHIRQVMQLTVNITTELRNAFLQKSCRHLNEQDHGLRFLKTPGMEPPKWPYKGCAEVSSSLDEDAEQDAPQNDDADISYVGEPGDGDEGDDADEGDGGGDGSGALDNDRDEGDVEGEGDDGEGDGEGGDDGEGDDDDDDDNGGDEGGGAGTEGNGND